MKTLRPRREVWRWRAKSFVVTALCTVAVAAVTPGKTAELASSYTCQRVSSPEKVVIDFRDRGFVGKTPYANIDAVQSYAGQPGHTVFGFPFVALIAWEEDSKFFGRGPGTSPGTHFSLVVQANPWQLRNAARKQGVKLARGRDFQLPEVRVDGFNSENPDELPKRADQRFAYAQITCRPRP